MSIDLLEELEISIASRDIDLLEDSYSRLVPGSEYPGFDPNFSSGYGYGRTPRPIHNPSDRMGGKHTPVYETERDLAMIRSTSRNLAGFSNTQIGASEALANYIFHTGMSFVATERLDVDEPVDEDTLRSLNRFIEDFLEHNRFHNNLDREIHQRTLEDGEVFIIIHPRGKMPTLSIIDPGQVTQPIQEEELEVFLETDGIVNFWGFGIHTTLREDTQEEDFDQPLGYHIVYNDAGTDWDYIKADRMFHLTTKRTPRNAKRGIPDYFWIQNDLEREVKLRRNTAESAAIHAAIVGIRKHASGVTRDAVQSMHKRISDHDYQRNPSTSHAQRRYAQIYDRPHIKDIPNGMDWMAGPLGTLNHPTFIEVRQMLLRSIGTIWNMPEYMISGDASNAAFASTLVAESPFVKSRQSDQVYYGDSFIIMLWKVIKLSMRRIDTKLSYLELREHVRIQGIYPEVATRDETKTTQRHQILNTARILSLRTWAKKENLDYDLETKNMIKEPDPAPAVTGGNNFNVGGPRGTGELKERSPDSGSPAGTQPERV